jgi:hypothetical protein
MPPEFGVHTTIFPFQVLLPDLLAVVVLIVMSIVVSPYLSPTPGTESSLSGAVKATRRALSGLLGLLASGSTVGATGRSIFVFGAAFIAHHSRTLSSISVGQHFIRLSLHVDHLLHAPREL